MGVFPREGYAELDWTFFRAAKRVLVLEQSPDVQISTAMIKGILRCRTQFLGVFNNESYAYASSRFYETGIMNELGFRGIQERRRKITEFQFGSEEQTPCSSFSRILKLYVNFCVFVDPMMERREEDSNIGFVPFFDLSRLQVKRIFGNFGVSSSNCELSTSKDYGPLVLLKRILHYPRLLPVNVSLDTGDNNNPGGENYDCSFCPIWAGMFSLPYSTPFSSTPKEMQKSNGERLFLVIALLSVVFVIGAIFLIWHGVGLPLGDKLTL
jgi:hypothetical protein